MHPNASTLKIPTLLLQNTLLVLSCRLTYTSNLEKIVTFFCCFAVSGPITFTYDGHGYFYSGDVEAHADDKVDWLEARNTCREYCMDLVSIETPSENDLLEELIAGGEISKIMKNYVKK